MWEWSTVNKEVLCPWVFQISHYVRNTISPTKFLLKVQQVSILYWFFLVLGRGPPVSEAGVPSQTYWIRPSGIEPSTLHFYQGQPRYLFLLIIETTVCMQPNLFSKTLSSLGEKSLPVLAIVCAHYNWRNLTEMFKVAKLQVLLNLWSLLNCWDAFYWGLFLFPFLLDEKRYVVTEI